MGFKKSIEMSRQSGKTEVSAAEQILWCFSSRSQLRSLIGEALVWRAAVLGYCSGCGARIDPAQMRPMPFTYVCANCENGLEEWFLFSAFHDC